MLPRHGVTPALIYEARRRISGQVVRSPLIHSAALSARFDAAIYLKLETCQPSGAFKLRGATNMVAALIEARGRESLSAGVTTRPRGITAGR
ncbi:pyridoxal-phosphate dependent enzyme [Halomonas sp. BC04]|uniref:pyridoxal-phosphate dependent enzyme n=1 Tax=Halomonas sp. BC04 TaxID=1403540 RepID=UPI0022B05722|nr:pyridoxal-phosphate dependent enzyme [Halomonas sp. BC04]